MGLPSKLVWQFWSSAPPPSPNAMYSMPSGPKCMSPALWLDCGWSTVNRTRLLDGARSVRGAVLVGRHSRITLRWSGTTPERSQGPGGSGRQREGGGHGWVERLGGVGEQAAVGGEGRAEEAPLSLGSCGPTSTELTSSTVRRFATGRAASMFELLELADLVDEVHLAGLPRRGDAGERRGHVTGHELETDVHRAWVRRAAGRRSAPCRHPGRPQREDGRDGTDNNDDQQPSGRWPVETGWAER